MVGWQEYIIVPRAAPLAVIEEAARLHEALEAYPILDDDAVSEAESEAKASAWREMSLMDRVELIEEAGGNIFAARCEYITEAADPTGSLLDYVCH